MGEELFENETETTMTREQAAEALHALADALARNNEIEVLENGRTVRVAVPATVTYEVEVEVSQESSEIEISLSW